jgi:hypothetical protein
VTAGIVVVIVGGGKVKVGCMVETVGTIFVGDGSGSVNIVTTEVGVLVGVVS